MRNTMFTFWDAIEDEDERFQDPAILTAKIQDQTEKAVARATAYVHRTPIADLPKLVAAMRADLDLGSDSGRGVAIAAAAVVRAPDLREAWELVLHYFTECLRYGEIEYIETVIGDLIASGVVLDDARVADLCATAGKNTRDLHTLLVTLAPHVDAAHVRLQMQEGEALQPLVEWLSNHQPQRALVQTNDWDMLLITLEALTRTSIPRLYLAHINDRVHAAEALLRALGLPSTIAHEKLPAKEARIARELTAQKPAHLCIIDAHGLASPIAPYLLDLLEPHTIPLLILHTGGMGKKVKILQLFPDAVAIEGGVIKA